MNCADGQLPNVVEDAVGERALLVSFFGKRSRGFCHAVG
jgi:hypothetical protein